MSKPIKLIILGVISGFICMVLLVWLCSRSSAGFNNPEKESYALIRLNNGQLIPNIGLGTWTMDDDQAREAVKEAVSVGYRHIDTAWRYGNEVGVGQALKE
ncbi:unnamed protein product, partial [Oppiella nova]